MVLFNLQKPILAFHHFMLEYCQLHFTRKTEIRNSLDPSVDYVHVWELSDDET